MLCKQALLDRIVLDSLVWYRIGSDRIENQPESDCIRSDRIGSDLMGWGG